MCFIDKHFFWITTDYDHLNFLIITYRFLTECVAVAIISQHSVDEVIFGSNFNYDNEEKVDFAEVGSKKEFMSLLANHFCTHGGTVLESTKTGGKYVHILNF